MCRFSRYIFGNNEMASNGITEKKRPRFSGSRHLEHSELFAF